MAKSQQDTKVMMKGKQMDINRAIALAYGDKASKILASGKDKLAQQIVQKARELEIPIFQNEQLVDSLLDFEIDESVDSATQEALVKVLLWLNENEKNMQLSKS